MGKLTEPSYHDLHVATNTMERTQFSWLPFNLFLMCTRTAGWELWDSGDSGNLANARLVAGEYNPKGLRLDVGGSVIVDSIARTQNTPDSQRG